MRERQRVGNKIWGVVIVALLCLVLYICVSCYCQWKIELYEEKIEKLQIMLDTEKKWIKVNQEESGAICLNMSNGAKDVNPYFACQAAMGLLAGDVSLEDMMCVADYLEWHTEQLVYYEGIVTNYRNTGKGMEPIDEYDSVDSYLALYLTLLCEYAKQGGNLAKIEYWEEAVLNSIWRLEDLLEDGLTQVSEETEIFYLMDNLEVWESCHKMCELLKSDNNLGISTSLRETFYERFQKLENKIEKAIKENLWNEEEQRFEIGLGKNGKVLNYQAWSEFYPDGIVQVYATACGFSLDIEKEKILYEEMCEHFSWEILALDGEFDWAVSSYIAVGMGDIERVEIFLNNYQNVYSKERKYPLHVAESGWTARTCGELIAYYREKIEKLPW